MWIVFKFLQNEYKSGLRVKVAFLPLILCDFTVYMRGSKVASALYQIELVNFGAKYLITLMYLIIVLTRTCIFGKIPLNTLLLDTTRTQGAEALKILENFKLITRLFATTRMDVNCKFPFNTIISFTRLLDT